MHRRWSTSPPSPIGTTPGHGSVGSRSSQNASSRRAGSPDGTAAGLPRADFRRSGCRRAGSDVDSLLGICAAGRGFSAWTGSPRPKEGRGSSVAEDDPCQVLASLHHNGEKMPWFQCPGFAILEPNALSSDTPCEARSGRSTVVPGDVVQPAQAASAEYVSELKACRANTPTRRL